MSILLANLISLLIGFAKTGIPGLGVLNVVLLALFMDDARLSVGVMLPLLLSSDLWAVGFYRKHADWALIRSLVLPIAVGMVCGGIILWQIENNDLFKRLLGGVVLGLITVDVVRRMQATRSGSNSTVDAGSLRHRVFSVSMGAATGVATTLGNAAGPIMSIYLFSRGLDKKAFMGSMAWMFLLINASKVPLYVNLNMITADTLLLNARMLPGIVVGALTGRWVLQHIPQVWFLRLVLGLAFLASLRLCFG